MAMYFEKQKKRKRKHPEMGFPEDRFQTQEDLKALARAKRIEKDLPRHAKVRSLAKEKMAERKSRGKSQAMVSRKDNTIPKGTVKEHKFPQEHVD
jgi:hypothetical protein